MPFSNRTNRQRCENGQVVPEYRTIIAKFPDSKNSRTACAAQAVPDDSAAVGRERQPA